MPTFRRAIRILYKHNNCQNRLINGDIQTELAGTEQQTQLAPTISEKFPLPRRTHEPNTLHPHPKWSRSTPSTNRTATTSTDSQTVPRCATGNEARNHPSPHIISTRSSLDYSLEIRRPDGIRVGDLLRSPRFADCADNPEELHLWVHRLLQCNS